MAKMMNRDEVREIVYDKIGFINEDLDQNTIREESNLEYDLEIDSQDRFELLYQIEQRFGIELPEGDKDIGEIETVKHMIDAVMKRNPTKS